MGDFFLPIAALAIILALREVSANFEFGEERKQPNPQRVVRCRPDARRVVVAVVQGLHDNAPPVVGAEGSDNGVTMVKEDCVYWDIVPHRSTSQFKGVSWNKHNIKWKAMSKGKYLGHHATEEEAARAIDDYIEHGIVPEWRTVTVLDFTRHSQVYYSRSPQFSQVTHAHPRDQRT